MKTRSLTIRLPEALYLEAEARAGAGTKTEAVVAALSQAWGLDVEKVEAPSMSFAELVEEVGRLRDAVKELQSVKGNSQKKAEKESEENQNLLLFSEVTFELNSPGVELTQNNDMPEGSQLMKGAELKKVLEIEAPETDWKKSLKTYTKNKRGREKNIVGKCLFRHWKNPEKKPGEEHQFWVKYPI
jgi:hypothetical protein